MTNQTAARSEVSVAQSAIVRGWNLRRHCRGSLKNVNDKLENGLKEKRALKLK
jgi:exonuclease VII small subunit